MQRWRSRDQQVPVIDWLQNVMDVGINSGIFHESDRNRFNLGEVYRMTEVVRAPSVENANILFICCLAT